MDDKNKKGRQDRALINTHEDYEMRYWSDKFHCSKDELKSAVDKVGNSARKVESYLGRSR